MANSILKTFNSSGNFDAELLYSVLYDKLPCKYEFEIDIESLQLDSEQIKYDFVKHLFKDVVCVRTYCGESIDEDDNHETIEVTDGPYIIKLDDLSSDESNALCVAADNKVIYINYKGLSIYYDFSESFDSIKQLAKTIFESFPKAKPEEKSARVGLIKYNQGDYYTTFSDIKRTHINLEENYNDDFPSVYKDIEDFLHQRESGLILLWGNPGTGKTSLIRHLCTNVPNDYVIVPNSVASRLGDPDFISYITSCKDYVFILEDCEQLLMDRTDNPWNNAITTILNMADGLLSDVVNIKFICTFNAKVDKIDKALLRKGRCFAKYEFKELSADKVKILNDKYDLKIPEIKEMTLAEIYNAERRDYSEEENKTPKIGF